MFATHNKRFFFPNNSNVFHQSFFSVFMPWENLYFFSVLLSLNLFMAFSCFFVWKLSLPLCLCLYSVMNTIMLLLLLLYYDSHVENTIRGKSMSLVVLVRSDGVLSYYIHVWMFVGLNTLERIFFMYRGMWILQGLYYNI